jgi:hypothetical protein
VLQKREYIRSLLASLLPAALTGFVCALLSSSRFGFWPTWNALFPGNGSHSYEALHFGLFGNGRSFWLPPLTTFAQFAKYYALTPAGFWIICTLGIVVFGALSLRKLWHAADMQHETMFIIAACHGIFLCTFFGWPGTRTYYSSLLIAGVAFGLFVHRVRPALIASVIAVALLGNVERYQITANAWRWMKRSPDTAGLWAFDNMRAEWNQARALAGDRHLLYLNNGCAELLFPNMDAPASFFLEPGSQKPIEIERLRQQLKQASVVVTFNQGLVLDPWYWKEFAAERELFVDSWRGVYLTVHERLTPIAPRPSTNQL